jgi:hypothetical protein
VALSAGVFIVPGKIATVAFGGAPFSIAATNRRAESHH